MSKKLHCDSCETETSHDLYDLRITQCGSCGNWDIGRINWLLALKLKELGFDWHTFANKVDEFAAKGTAKELFLEELREVSD